MYPITILARILEVSTVHQVFEEYHGIYGSRKIAHELTRRHIRICRNTVAQIMSELCLKSRAQKRKRFVITTDSNHAYTVPPNRLNRCFDAATLNEKWVADITYVPTREG